MDVPNTHYLGNVVLAAFGVPYADADPRDLGDAHHGLIHLMADEILIRIRSSPASLGTTATSMTYTSSKIRASNRRVRPDPPLAKSWRPVDGREKGWAVIAPDR